MKQLTNKEVIVTGAVHKGVTKTGPYVASKSTVLRLTESMALELRNNNINVICILPGTLDTLSNRQDMPHGDFEKWVLPTDIAKVTDFLSSEQASAIHGACVPVSGLS